MPKNARKPDPAPPAAPIHRKPSELRKETQIHIRMTETQKAALTQAAAREGLELSAWIRSTLLKAAGLTGV